MPGTIRCATKVNAAQIAQIIGELVSEPDPVGWDRALTTEEVEAWIDRQGEDSALFVVEDRGKVLGFASIEQQGTSGSAQVSFGAWVRAINRRQGHGSLLAEHCLAFARSRGYKSVLARLPENNEPALSYLSSIGALIPLMNPGMTFELPADQPGAERPA